MIHLFSLPVYPVYLVSSLPLSLSLSISLLLSYACLFALPIVLALAQTHLIKSNLYAMHLCLTLGKDSFRSA